MIPEEPTDDKLDEVKIPVANSMDMTPINSMNTPIIGMEIDPELLLKRAESNIDVQKKLRLLALRATNKSDWVNQNGKPYLQWSGASKVAGVFGVSYGNIKYIPTQMQDEKGDYLIIECIGDVLFQGRSIPEAGTGTTRDPFFALRKNKQTGEKYFLPLSEVDITNIKKKALTNFLNRGLKSMCGLSFEWEEVNAVTQGEISEVTTTGIAYKGTPPSIPTNNPMLTNTGVASVKDRLWGMLKQMHGKDAGITLQALTTWTDKSGKTVKGKDNIQFVSDKQASFKIKEVQKIFDEWEKKQVVKEGLVDDFTSTPREEPPMPIDPQDDVPF